MNSIHDFETKEKTKSEQQQNHKVEQNAVLTEAASEALAASDEALKLTAQILAKGVAAALPERFPMANLPKFPKINLPPYTAPQFAALAQNLEDLTKQIEKALEVWRPFLDQFDKEVARLQALSEYKNADLSRYEFDFEDEEHTILADTQHNKGLQLAIDRSSLGFPERMTKTAIDAMRTRERVKKVKFLSAYMVSALTNKNIINSGLTHYLYPLGPKSNIITTVQAGIPANAILKNRKNLTYGEITVLNAIHTLAFHGKFAFTLRELYRVIARLQRNDNPSLDVQAKIEAAIETLVNTVIRIDASDEVKRINRKTGKPIKKLIFEDYLINLGTCEVDGEKYFVIQGYPILLDYADFTDHLITLDEDCLTIKTGAVPKGVNPDTGKLEYDYTGKPLSMTWENILMRNKLKERIDQMLDPSGWLRDENQNPVIRFEPIFEAAGIKFDPSDRSTFKKHRDAIRKIMEYFENEGITHGCGWEDYPEGRGKKIVGIKIIAKEKPVKERSIFPKKVAEE